jgi:hypothetical protein
MKRPRPTTKAARQKWRIILQSEAAVGPACRYHGQKVEKKVWHLSALGAALPQFVGHIVGDVARPSFVGIECDYPNGIVALSL